MREEHIDFAGVMDAEIERLGDPTPIPISRLGPRLIDQMVRQRFKDKGVPSFTASQYRAALRSLLAELLDTSRDPVTAAEFQAQIEHELTTVIGEQAMTRLMAKGAVSYRGYCEELESTVRAVSR